MSTFIQSEAGGEERKCRILVDQLLICILQMHTFAACGRVSCLVPDGADTIIIVIFITQGGRW